MNVTAESQDCGTVCGWLMFIVALNILVSVLGMLVTVLGIIGMCAEKITEKCAWFLLCYIMILSGFYFLVNLLPIMAEVNGQPQLYPTFKNLTIAILVFHILSMFVTCCVNAARWRGNQESGSAAASNSRTTTSSRLVPILLDVITILLVNARMDELQ